MLITHTVISFSVFTSKPTGAHLCEAVFVQKLPQMSTEVSLQWLFASDKREAASKFLRHDVTSPAQLVLVDFRGKVFDDKFSSRDASNRDGPLHDGDDNL